MLNFSGGSYATFDESLSGGIKKGPFDVYVSQSWMSTDGHRDHSRAQQQNYYANIGYQINKEWNIRFLANYVNSQTLAPMPDITPTATNGVSWPGAERYDTETILTTLTLNHQYEHVSGYLKAYWNDTDFDLLQELNERQALRERHRRTLVPAGDYALRSPGKRKTPSLVGWRNFGRSGPGYDRPEKYPTDIQRAGGPRNQWRSGRKSLGFSRYNALFSLSGHKSDESVAPEGFHIIPSAGFRYFNHNEFKDKSAPQAGLVTGYGHTDLNINYSRGVNYPSPVVLMNMVLTRCAGEQSQSVLGKDKAGSGGPL